MRGLEPLPARDEPVIGVTWAPLPTDCAAGRQLVIQVAEQVLSVFERDAMESDKSQPRETTGVQGQDEWGFDGASATADSEVRYRKVNVSCK
jgi:hypothetical protein